MPNLLKNWTIERIWNGNVVIRGEIYNDTKHRFSDGTSIRTSSVQYIDFVAGVVRTRNSVYNLDKGVYDYG